MKDITIYHYETDKIFYLTYSLVSVDSSENAGSVKTLSLAVDLWHRSSKQG